MDSCDLKSCYGRVVHAFATLAMWRGAAAEFSATSMFDTIQKLKYKIQTGLWDSDATFGGESWRDLEALMGVGQENRTGPAI